MSFEGLTIEQVGLERRGRRYTPCPACGAERTGRSDKRAPVLPVSGGRGWKCYACDEQGGAVHALCLRLHGERLGKGDGRWADVMRWMEERHHIEPRAQPEPQTRREPVYMDVAPVLRMCRPAEQGAADWLRSRGYTRPVPAGMLPPGWSAPWWPWRDEFPLVVPAFDAAGVLRSMHGRAIRPGARRKVTWPLGGDTRGLVMASKLARAMLRGETEPRRLLIVEGLTDYLWAAQDPTIAVLGIASGVDLAPLSRRLRRGMTIVIATDPDPAGDAYAQTVAAQLAPHPVRRLHLGR